MKSLPKIVHIDSNCRLPFPVTVITCRTASRSNKSLYELGILVVEDGKEIINRVIRINPQTRTFTLAKEIDNVTFEDVRNEPTFDKIWPEIAPYIIGNKNIVTHYAEFHLNVLFAMMEKYKIEVPDFKLLDIRHISMLLGDELSDYKFETMAANYGCNRREWNTATKIVTIYDILFKLYREEPQAMEEYVLGRKTNKKAKAKGISLQKEILEPINQTASSANNAGCSVFLVMTIFLVYIILFYNV